MAEHLTTGWEPDLPADDSLVRAYVLATVERNAALAEAGGGTHHRTEAAAFADSGSRLVFDNSVTFLRPPTAAVAGRVVAEALDLFPPERPFGVLSAWPVPEAGDLGIRLMGHPPFMFRPPGPPPEAARRPDLDLRPVTDADGLQTFWQTLAEAYPLPGARGTTLTDPAVLRTGVRLFVGYEGDHPVGTAGVWVGHGVNDVEWISVYERHRGKGYGEALTWAVTLAEPADPAVLIASDPGQAVYERMGYLRLARMTMWWRPGHDG